MTGRWRPEQGIDRLMEPRLHHHLISGDHDNPLELRDIRPFGSKVNRFHIKERIVDGDNYQIASDDPAAFLIPQRQLLGYGRVLIDHGLNLDRTQCETFLGKLVDHQISILGKITLRRHPCDHIIPALGRERHHEDVLKLLRIGQAHEDIIGL